jgi:hypothetical protein
MTAVSTQLDGKVLVNSLMSRLLSQLPFNVVHPFAAHLFLIDHAHNSSPNVQALNLITHHLDGGLIGHGTGADSALPGSSLDGTRSSGLLLDVSRVGTYIL